MPDIYDLQVTSIEGRSETLDRYRDHVLLIVNVASQCGLTPQYSELEGLYRQYRDRDFVVLGFPCNQFGHQEPGDEAEIKSFCTRSYDVTFPLFAKIDVNGPAAHPLYQFLKSQRKGIFGTRAIKWNFTKFLVDKQGNVVKRYAPMVGPASIEREISRLLREFHALQLLPRFGPPASTVDNARRATEIQVERGALKILARNELERDFRQLAP